MTQAIRSPGSTLKPFIYGMAFDEGLAAPDTILEDAPKRFGDYQPENFDRVFHGRVTAREALTHSLNMEECGHGIRATAFCPGEVATPLLDKRPVPVTAEDKARMLQMEDCGAAIAYVANSPPHVCFNEIVISPTWNRIFLNNPM